MWFNNPRDKAVKGRLNRSFKILNGYENTDRNIFFLLNRTRGHEVTLVKDQCRLDN